MTWRDDALAVRHPVTNLYDDQQRATAYASLQYPGTYALAFRDLPAIIGEHVRGRKALDFGCGAGRSTRFLRELGFDVAGVDISAPMIASARTIDPEGDYRLLPDGDLGGLPLGSFDLVLAAFPFDNIGPRDRKVAILKQLQQLLTRDGRIVNLVSSPDIYVNEWTSFSTRDHPENRVAGTGDTVRIVMLDVEDRRPVEDLLWTDEAYRNVYQHAGLEVAHVHRPLGRPDDGHAWVNETRIAPWVIYVLKRWQ